jgi:hypothetical protein
LSYRLIRSLEALVGAALIMALMALMLALFPAVAEAQSEAQADAQSISSIVVRPGDCLWSITSERLGPNASPQQIANGVERLYALNRNLIGADPNLIFAGQVLSLPPMVEPSRGKPRTGVRPQRSAEARPAVRNATEPAAASPRGRGGNGGKHETEQASSTTVGEDGSKARQAPEPVAKPLAKPLAKPVALPGMPAKQVIPKVDSLSQTESPSPVESFGRTARSLLFSAISAVVGLFPQADRLLLLRKLLGLGIMALTLLVVALMMWKLPMKRFTRWDDEVWGRGAGDYGSAPNRIAPFAYHPGSLEERAKEGAHRPGGTLGPVPPKPEWEPSVDLKDSLLNMPLQGKTLPPENLEAIRFQVEVALEALAWLEQHRELFDTERQRQAALEDLLGELSVMAKAPG